ncbi:MAG: hypothetical protein ABI856_13610 [Nitrospira sp.]
MPTSRGQVLPGALPQLYKPMADQGRESANRDQQSQRILHKLSPLR